MNLLPLALISAVFLSSCATMPVPKNYIADKEVVFLQQKTELKPIVYPISIESPYKWEYNITGTSIENPSYKKIANFETLLKPDPMMDAKLFVEVRDYLVNYKDSAFLKEAISKLNSYPFAKPEKKIISKGMKIKDYKNAVEYRYPHDAKASIIYYNDGSYRIDYADGRMYYQQKDSSYFELDKNKNEVYAVFPASDSYRLTVGGNIYHLQGGERSLKTTDFQISKTTNPVPQYVIEQFNSKEQYNVFIKENDEVIAIKNINPSGIGFFYGLEEGDNKDYVHVANKDNRVIYIDNNYKKTYATYKSDDAIRSVDKILSVYTSGGLRFTDFYEDITHSEINPQWPENYIKKEVGNFDILYTKKDQELISKIDGEKLILLSDTLKKSTSLDFKPRRAIIIPPDLKSYTKLFVNKENQTIHWYPAGFETKDYIVMWPVSVPRYNLDIGNDYFWNKEFYLILIHELTHLAVNENIGILSRAPVWLHEGLAIYVEGVWSKDSKDYWDTTFKGSLALGKMLPWDQVTLHSTSHFPISQARVHYSQSYKMVSYLADTYGTQNLKLFIKSFKEDVYNPKKDDLLEKYQKNFLSIYKISWQQNLKNFDVFCKQL